MIVAATRLHQHGVVSGLSAAVLHGLPLLRTRIPAKLHVTRSYNGTNSPWVQARRSKLGDDDVVEVSGVRVTSIRRTIEDLATELPTHELLAAADGGLAQGASLDGISRRYRGRRMLAWIEQHANARAESFGESWSRCVFIEHSVPVTNVQATVRDDEGAFVARVDFAAGGVIGEFDGKAKYTRFLSPGESAADAVMREKRREQVLQDLGYRVVRWDWSALQQPEILAQRMRLALADAGGRRCRGSVTLESVRRITPPKWHELIHCPAPPRAT